MPEHIRQLVLSLCRDVEEVINNNDWPTVETPEEKVSEIRDYLGEA